ncbi:MAG: sigma-70 family RNA polymerase sigma factor [Lacipirellulaceae bacterium]
MPDDKASPGDSENVPPAEHDRFVLEIIAAQGRLYAYILSLLLDRDRAHDVLQQTNIVLLEKESEFQWGTNFGAWACSVAFYEVLSERRSRTRDRHLFNDELLALIAVDAEAEALSIDQRRVALEACLKGLTQPQKELLTARYAPGGSVEEMADVLNKTPGAVSAMLHRIRAKLAKCIAHRLRGSAES